MEQIIGATELRQRLTDVLQVVREEQATYVVATFDRPQAALVNLDEYRQFQQFKSEREAFFDWLTDTASKNAALNTELSDDDVLAIIGQARNEVNESISRHGHRQPRPISAGTGTICNEPSGNGATV